MLNSRYVHLSEALGMGALWLKQGATWLPEKSQAPKAIGTANNAPKLVDLSAKKQPHYPEKQSTLSEAIAENKLIEMRLRLIYAVSSNNYGQIVWLTLRSDLSLSAAQMNEQGAFNHILGDWMIASGTQNAVSWHQACTDKATWEQTLHHLSQNNNVISWLILGEEISSFFHINQWIEKNIPQSKIIELPHPAILLRNQRLKKSAWEKYYSQRTNNQ